MWRGYSVIVSRNYRPCWAIKGFHQPTKLVFLTKLDASMNALMNISDGKSVSLRKNTWTSTRLSSRCNGIEIYISSKRYCNYYQTITPAYNWMTTDILSKPTLVPASLSFDVVVRQEVKPFSHSRKTTLVVLMGRKYLFESRITIDEPIEPTPVCFAP